MRILRTWDENERKAALKIAGLCVAALAIFTFTAIVSYLFHWKEDMSLLGDAAAMDPSVPVGNFAGKLGYRAGHLLVSGLFGLGSLSLPIILVAISLRLLLGKWKYSMLKTVLVAVFGAFVSSLVLACAGDLLGFSEIFGAGPGGACGYQAIVMLNNLIGVPVTVCVTLIVLVAYLIFALPGFTERLAMAGNKVEGKGTEQQEEVFELQETEIDVIPEPSQPEPSQPDPQPQTELPQPQPQPQQPVEGSFEIISDSTLDAEVVQDLKPIDNRLDPPEGLPKYKAPSLDLLKSYNSGRHDVTTEELTRNNNKIRAALANYRIQVSDVKAVVGPTVTLYKVYPAPGVKIADIKKLQEDIALSLNAKGVRVVTLSDSVGIEVANDFSSIVPLKSLLNDKNFRDSKADLPVAIGYTITQEVKVFDLADAPHLLIAGATKQGKSVGLNVIVSSLLYSMHPSELKMVFIDPKMVEFSAYSHLIKHYLAVLPDAVSEEDEMQNAIVKKPKDAEKILRSLCTEMDDRYELLSKAGVNNIKLYNAKYKERHLRPDHGHRFLPYLVVVVDEYADLTMMTGASPEARSAARSITNSIIRLGQKGRAAGLHVILATQRPSVDVISGIIKSQFPMRIAFRVASRVDSMTILDNPGAEKLIGKGDMLLQAGIESERIQCAYIGGDEIDAINDFIGSQQGYGKCYNTPYYLPTPAEAEGEGGEGGGGGSVDIHNLDARFEEAAKMVVLSQRGSTSDLQRKLGMGYAKAGRVMDQLEAAGIVGPQEGSKPRQVLVPDLNTLQPILDSFLNA